MAQASNTKTSTELAAQFFGADKQRQLAERRKEVKKGKGGGGKRSAFLGHGRYILRIDSFKMEETHPSKGSKTYAALRGVIAHRLSTDDEADAHVPGAEVFYGIWSHTAGFMDDLLRCVAGIFDCEVEEIDTPMVLAAMSDSEGEETFTVLSVDESGNETEDEVTLELQCQPLKGWFIEVNAVKRAMSFQKGEHAGKPKLDEAGNPKFFTNVYVNGTKSAVELAEILTEDEQRKFCPDLEDRILAEAEAEAEEEEE